MVKAMVRIPKIEPIVIGSYTLTETGLIIKGKPSYGEHEGVGDFIKRAHRCSGFWMADWLRYGETRADWTERLSQIVDATGLSEKRVKNIRAVGGIEQSVRRPGVEFGLHEVVAGLAPSEQAAWLERCESNGWDRHELRLNLKAAKRKRIIDGQAVLKGQYRVIYADYPWLYGNRQPSGSGALDHFPGMTIEAGCELPVKAHSRPDAVLFFWVTAPMLMEAPGPRDIIHAWGFEPKTQIIWDKVEHNVGSYVSVRHELLIIATRGSCTPDRPTPMIDSVVTERRIGEHSAKPETFRKIIERMYDGPYLELFGREPVVGWDVFGNDARLWAEQAAAS